MTQETFTYFGKNRIYLGARAQLIVTDREIASEWAANHIVINPAHAWIVGRYAEADRANSNQQYFSLDGLRMGRPSLAHSPMNLNHSGRNIVGAFVASELMYPTGETAGTENLNPYIESLGVFWRYYFPEEYARVKNAHEEGALFFSMECVPRAVATVGGADDSKEYEYDGIKSPSYPKEINERQVAINLLDPHFVGGALIIPPARPGWAHAEVTNVAQRFEKEWEMAEKLYEDVKAVSPELSPAQWEAVMADLMAKAD